jgi:hypothetical protein
MAATTIEPTPNTGGERPAGGKAKAEVAAPVPKRTYWRAIVRTGGQVHASRERDRVEWHLASCATPNSEGGHCTEGRHLIETIGHPDGHCIQDGKCGLCGAEAPRD